MSSVFSSNKFKKYTPYVTTKCFRCFSSPSSKQIYYIRNSLQSTDIILSHFSHLVDFHQI